MVTKQIDLRENYSLMIEASLLDLSPKPEFNSRGKLEVRNFARILKEIDAVLLSLTHVLTIVFIQIIQATKVQPSVDEVQRELKGEVAAIGVNIFACVVGRDANLTTEIGLGITAKCNDIRGFRIVVELFM